MSPSSMKRGLLGCLAIALALTLGACTNKALGTEIQGPHIGQNTSKQVISVIPPARRSRRPDFSGTTLDGATLTAASLRGTIVVVNFWASWCGPCNAEEPVLQKLWTQLRSQGVRFVGVDIRDDLVNARAFRDGFHVTYPSIFNKDASIAAAFVMNDPPSTFVLDRAGREAVFVSGPVTDPAAFTAAIATIEAE